MAKSRSGPADLYGLPPLVGYVNHDVRKQRMPRYTFGAHTTLPHENVGPGPGKYNLERLGRYGVSKANKFSMASRNILKDKDKRPGPLSYAVHKAPNFKGSRAPAYSFGRVNTFVFKIIGPGPNKYGINEKFIKIRSPAYTMASKNFLKEPQRSPGPAQYSGDKLNLIKPSSPKYTMTPRNEYKFKLCGPGSNYYNRSNYKPGKRAAKYSFGIRHSARSGNMIVPCDNI